MDRINGAGHIGRRFVAEDADLGRPPTLITDAWLNLVQEEIVNVILAAGGTLDGEQEDQLLQSINDLIQAASNAFVSVGGTADAITATYAPVIAALTNGMTVYVRAASANATATPTFTPASGVIAAKAIVKGAGAALVAGDVAGAGHWIELQYDQTLDKWVLQNPATGVSITTVPDATTAVKGKVQLATSAEAQALADGLKAITPATLAGAFQGGNQVLATIAAQKLPGGFIVQKGTITLSGTTGSVTFADTFLTSCSIVVAPTASTTSAPQAYISSKSNSGFTLNYSGTAATFDWIAFGY